MTHFAQCPAPGEYITVEERDAGNTLLHFKEGMLSTSMTLGTDEALRSALAAIQLHLGLSDNSSQGIKLTAGELKRLASNLYLKACEISEGDDSLSFELHLRKPFGITGNDRMISEASTVCLRNSVDPRGRSMPVSHTECAGAFVPMDADGRPVITPKMKRGVIGKFQFVLPDNEQATVPWATCQAVYTTLAELSAG